MTSASLDERILGTLKGLIEHHSSSRSIAEQMGQAHNYVARILRGETKLRLDVLGRILETLGVSHRFFMETALVDRPDDGDALEILRFFCGNAPPTKAFLEDIQPTLDVLVQMPLSDGDHPSLREELDRLESLRRSDRQAAAEGLQHAVLEMLSDPPVPVPRQMLEDLAVALATYGTVQRFEGLRADAARAYSAAFQIALRSDRPRAMALSYNKAAYLVRDLGQVPAALRFLERALDRFLRAGEIQMAGSVFLDKAVFWVSLGEFETAARDYQAALGLLQDEQVFLRHACWSGLAQCFQRLGDPAQALSALEKAEALHRGGEDLALAFLVRNRADLAAELGDHDGANRQYRRAVELLARFSEPIDAALCALDWASLLMKLGEAAAVKQLADEMLEWLPIFRGSRVADAVITELIRCAKWGELTGKVLANARDRLEKAARS
ncbi:MAG: tetratricopeptide repeat protein [Acidobacteriota bacterium]